MAAIGSASSCDRRRGSTSGPRPDRTAEHLGSTDVLIIRMRRRILELANNLRDHGSEPIGVNEPWVYKQRSGWTLLPKGVDYWDGTQEMRTQFQKEPPAQVVTGGPS